MQTVRLIVSVILLAVAAFFTRSVIDGLEQRRKLRQELAEISHVRYGMLNADQWVNRLVPILESKIDAFDLTASKDTLKPVVEKSLYRVLDEIKDRMSKPAPPAPSAGVTGATGATGAAPKPAAGFGNAMMANMMINALRPHVPEYTGVVLAQLGGRDTKDAVKKFFRQVLTDGAKNTFGVADMTWHDAILKKYACVSVAPCQEKLWTEIHSADQTILRQTIGVLLSAAVGFLVLLTQPGKLTRAATIVLLLYCVTLLVGGIFTPMVEVEARLTSVSMTFLGEPVKFTEQMLYFQSKSVLEVFRALIDANRPDMYIVGILVLMFSVVFPILKLISSSLALCYPSLLERSSIVRFFALESSKWSMADVMALAIFMAFVAFNGLIPNTMAGLTGRNAQLAIPTDSSRILPGYYIFIGFCLASLFLAKRLAHGIATAGDPQ